MTGSHELEKLEIDLLLEGVHERYGYDFRNYARASLVRRIRHRMVVESVETISGLLARILHDPECFDGLLSDLSIPVTEMFRDPDFFKAIRETVIPVLRTHPYVKIWHAGCATGEEAYSMAILLAEADLLSRTRIYATDYNRACLETARQGIYPADSVEDIEARYCASGGTASLCDYYHSGYDALKIRDELRKSIVFAHHNLAADQSFGEMNLVVCRNVLIYFDRKLQHRVLRLFHQSLCHRGFLGIGPKETVGFSNVHDRLEATQGMPSLYRRKD